MSDRLMSEIANELTTRIALTPDGGPMDPEVGRLVTTLTRDELGGLAIVLAVMLEQTCAGVAHHMGVQTTDVLSQLAPVFVRNEERVLRERGDL